MDNFCLAMSFLSPYFFAYYLISQCAYYYFLTQENFCQNSHLQKELVELLVCSNHDDEALYWSDHFKIPDDQLFEPVLILRSV